MSIIYRKTVSAIVLTIEKEKLLGRVRKITATLQLNDGSTDHVHWAYGPAIHVKGNLSIYKAGHKFNDAWDNTQKGDTVSLVHPKDANNNYFY